MIDLLNAFEKRRTKDVETATIFFENSAAAVQPSGDPESTSRFGYAVLTPPLDATALANVLSKYIEASEALSETFDITYAELADSPELTPIYLAVEGLTQASKDIAERVEVVVCDDDRIYGATGRKWREISRMTKKLGTV